MRNYLIVTYMMIALPLTANSALIDRGSGLIYDTALDITWLQDANYAKTSGYNSSGSMTWQEAMEWVGQLNYKGYSNWRLPNSDINGDGIITANFGSLTLFDPPFYFTDDEVVLRDNELAHLNTCPEIGAPCAILTGITDNNPEPFFNVRQMYWSSTQIDENLAVVGNFCPTVGFCDIWTPSIHSKDSTIGVWAVHDGDIGTVPVPASVWLFSSGLIGLIGFTRRKKA